jgi:hypothetical protein
MAKGSLDYNAVKELPDSFWKKVNKTDSCWLWLGKKDDGYGRTILPGYGPQQYLVHRLSFALLKDKIILNLQIDHLCKVRDCLNPDHLEQVTSKENTRRGLSNVYNSDPNKCPYGHEYTHEVPGKIIDGPMYKVCSDC